MLTSQSTDLEICISIYSTPLHFFPSEKTRPENYMGKTTSAWQLLYPTVATKCESWPENYMDKATPVWQLPYPTTATKCESLTGKYMGKETPARQLSYPTCATKCESWPGNYLGNETPVWQLSYLTAATKNVTYNQTKPQKAQLVDNHAHPPRKIFYILLLYMRHLLT